MIVEDIEGGLLHPSVIKRLRKLFKKLGWRVNPEDEFEEDDTAFDKFCLILADLDNEERELIFQLTENFLVCPSPQYRLLVKSALDEIPQSIIDSSGEIFLLPLIATKDVGKAKSSTSWLYSCLAEVIPRMPAFKGKRPRGYTDPDKLKIHNHRKQALILFCDDFVGTGDTAIDALTYYNKELKKNDDEVFVVTLVAQEKGAEAIMDFGFNIVFTKIINKGITDSNTLDKQKATEVMKKIEEKLKIKTGFNFGYKESEALVSMMRTPNNTFPVYWANKKKDGTRWASPFERT